MSKAVPTLFQILSAVSRFNNASFAVREIFFEGKQVSLELIATTPLETLKAIWPCIQKLLREAYLTDVYTQITETDAYLRQYLGRDAFKFFSEKPMHYGLILWNLQGR